ncbi:MAG: 3'(2'),5'-bisphosphate nucleotidase CysQ [Pseudomonadota bacterium]
MTAKSGDDMDTVLSDLALRAGAKIMEIYDSGDLGAETKADQSPVTAADLAANDVIAEGLAAAFPDIPAVTEEAAASHQQTGMARFFLVDPLDGTKEFINRRGEFTVNIALIEDGVPVAGVVYAPALGRLWATRGSMAVELGVADHKISAGTAKKLSVSSPDNDALVIVASKSHRDQATDDFIGRFKVADFTSAGSSLKFCLLAGGEADFYPRLGRTMEWDTAAGHAVLRAAGGEVIRFDDHSPFTYGKPEYENPFFLAFAPGLDLGPAKG